MTAVDMSDKEMAASISLLHMMQPASSDAEEVSTATTENKDALHNSLLKVVASQATDELSPKPKEKSKKVQRRTAHLTALSHELTLDELRAHFGKPIVEVAKEFGICTTFLKKICRRLGIKRWPHRQIRSIARTIHMLEQVEAAATTPQEKNKYATQIAQLKEKQRAVMENPDATGKLKRMKKYAAPKSDDTVALLVSPGSNGNSPVQHESNDASVVDISNSNADALAFAADSFLSAPPLESVTVEGAQFTEPLLVAIPEPDIPQISSTSTAPSPSSSSTPLHATVSSQTQSPTMSNISPCNRKLALAKVDAGAETRLRSSSISSLHSEK
ncbi:hypothetical protein PHYBOEH_000545 [Phytophthora boehmeriae]|uniref:RWP-RK domain-containing protein n=1 Tax=Phytophthora boehmeriae TaxID=109152 RepID=A0A8T1WTU4_9STRA|nr:hypothetical protein PHYBOEH_000545 [Phytophthora boehmeriae]